LVFFKVHYNGFITFDGVLDRQRCLERPGRVGAGIDFIAPYWATYKAGNVSWFMLEDESQKNDIIDDFRDTFPNNGIGEAATTDVLVITWLKMRSSGNSMFTVRKYHANPFYDVFLIVRLSCFGKWYVLHTAVTISFVSY